MNTNMLKPCPACGGKADSYKEKEYEYHVKCIKCGYDIKSDTLEVAMTVWEAIER